MTERRELLKGKDRCQGIGQLERCLIFDRDRVWHRTVVILSFARVKAETTGNCRPGSGDARTASCRNRLLIRYTAVVSGVSAGISFLTRWANLSGVTFGLFGMRRARLGVTKVGC